MSRQQRFIEAFPLQLAHEFQFLLERFYKKEITRRTVKQLMNEKVAIALNTVRPARIKK